MVFLDKWLSQCCGHANTDDSGRKTPDAPPERGLTILGTDTDVGKTYVAQLLIRQLVQRGLRVGAYKPVASGVEQGGTDSDPARLRQACGLDCAIESICPQMFRAPLAPPLAAAREGKAVDEALLSSGAKWWRDKCEVLIVEGAGGALSPLGWRTTVLDVAAGLGYPVVLVAAHRLGMMNHVLLTLEAVRARGLSVPGLIINQLEPPESGGQVRRDESMACLLPFCGKIDCYSLDYRGSTLFPNA